MAQFLIGAPRAVDEIPDPDNPSPAMVVADLFLFPGMDTDYPTLKVVYGDDDENDLMPNVHYQMQVILSSDGRPDSASIIDLQAEEGDEVLSRMNLFRLDDVDFSTTGLLDAGYSGHRGRSRLYLITDGYIAHVLLEGIVDASDPAR